jgi:hypothetical protein
LSSTTRLASHLLRAPVSTALRLTNVVPTARLDAAPATPLRAAGAQQTCPTRPHEPSHVRPFAPLKGPATRGFVVGAVVGIPGWHARGQGFKSPQLHPHNTAGQRHCAAIPSSPAELVSTIWGRIGAATEPFRPGRWLLILSRRMWFTSRPSWLALSARRLRAPAQGGVPSLALPEGKRGL